MFNRLESFLEQFPTNATCWSQATDEVYNLARTSREFLDEYDDVKVEAVDFATLELPLNGTVYAARPFGTTTTIMTISKMDFIKFTV